LKILSGGKRLQLTLLAVTVYKIRYHQRQENCQ
jgi:hypothetical protein